MNISEFIQWFITQVINITTKIINIIDNIIIYKDVSLLDFIIAIAIISMFLELILTIPINSMSKIERKIETNKERNKK